MAREIEASVRSRLRFYRATTTAIATVGFAVVSTVPVPAADVTNTVVVAVSGDASPQGVGELADHEPPVLGNGGMAAFAANIRQGTTRTGSGIFLGDGTNLLDVVLEGDSTPNQDGKFGAFTTLVSTPRINAANQVAFRNSLGSTAIQGGGHGLFVADPLASQIRELARSNTDTPFGSGTYENTTFSAFYTFNDAGQSALYHRALFEGYLSFLGGIFRPMTQVSPRSCAATIQHREAGPFQVCLQPRQSSR